MAEIHRYEATGIGRKEFKIKLVIEECAMQRPRAKQLVVCIDNEGYPASLERRKIYVEVPDTEAVKHGYRRVIDESGEDYLYPRAFFRPITLPPSVKHAVLSAE